MADTALTGLVVGAGLMLSANLATLRDQRGDAGELFDPVPIRVDARTIATLLACVVAGTVLGVAVIAAQVGSMLVNSTPVGRFDLAELANGVLVTILMTTVGVAAGRWTPGLIAAPIVILLFFWAVFQFATSWLLPVVPRADLVVGAPRPPAWHALYVLALILVFGAAAVLRHGHGPYRVGLVTVGTALAVLTATMSLTSPEAALMRKAIDRSKTPTSIIEGADHCVSSGGVTYCSFPSYTGWIPLWEQAVAPVVAALPSEVRTTLPTVRQRTATGMIDPQVLADNILPGTTWGRNGGEVASRRWLAAQMAAAATGLPREGQYSGGRAGCDLRGQARAIVVLWLIGQVERPVLPGRSSVYVRERGNGAERARTNVQSDFGAVDYGAAELAYAERLLTTADAGDRIRAGWRKLVDPATNVDEALPILGLTAGSAASKAEGTPCT
ncbi:hypothetical protein [Dactylosporangium sp. NPDC051484]|uniref:hypothetical protein n=1 Tax=Dactylosporangium sp. NPDC051484 TaxID=3154942 RepID=UPI00344DF905